MDKQAQNHEVLKRVHEIRVEIGKLMMDRAMGKLTNTNAIYQKKKEIARLLSGSVQASGASVAKSAQKSEPKQKKEKKEEK